MNRLGLVGRWVMYSCLMLPVAAKAQKLQPGFSKAEYLELMRISARQGDSTAWKNIHIAKPSHYDIVYRSVVTGLDNRWDLWLNRQDSVAVISLRGSTMNSVSWLENFYAAMVPATGKLQLNDSTVFSYQLADDDKAAVHTGWLIGMASMAGDIVHTIDSCYTQGIHNFYIMGHSQGGAIAYLLTSYLHYRQKVDSLPKNIFFKTYCSAAPKPGNLYYAYDYERLTTGGQGFNIVNTADWVPETPVSIQTFKDFNNTNPFADVKTIIKKQRFPVKIALRHTYNQLNKSTAKANKKYRKYLGKVLYKIIRKRTSGLYQPTYTYSMNYERTGNFIILSADDDYYKHFPDSKEKVFTHHSIGAYLYLLKKLP